MSTGGQRPAQESTSKRILIVDDNCDAALCLAMLLRMSGNDTQTAHDGLEAIQAATEFRPDVMLLDIGLPKLDGHEVCRRIRQQPWGQGILLIALTGSGEDEDRQSSQAAGFDHHLVKPVHHSTLLDVLSELRGKK